MKIAADPGAEYNRQYRTDPAGIPDAVYRAVAEDYVAEFNRLVRQWRRDTLALSFIDQKTAHVAFRGIVEMDDLAVPLILSELRRHPDFLFLALQEITGQNPVPPAAIGNPRAMIDAWLDWGEGRMDHAD